MLTPQSSFDESGLFRVPISVNSVRQSPQIKEASTQRSLEDSRRAALDDLIGFSPPSAQRDSSPQLPFSNPTNLPSQPSPSLPKTSQKTQENEHQEQPVVPVGTMPVSKLFYYIIYEIESFIFISGQHDI